MKKLAIPCGSVFLVPLNNGAFAAGVLIRSDKKGRAYGSFFGPAIPNSSAIEVTQLIDEDAIFRCRFGDHGLHIGRWQVVGKIPDWESKPWPMPKFSRQHDDPGMCVISEYDDCFGLVSESILPIANGRELPEDAQYGSGVVEVKLSRLLA